MNTCSTSTCVKCMVSWTLGRAPFTTIERLPCGGATRNQRLAMQGRVAREQLGEIGSFILNRVVFFYILGLFCDRTEFTWRGLYSQMFLKFIWRGFVPANSHGHIPNATPSVAPHYRRSFVLYPLNMRVICQL